MESSYLLTESIQPNPGLNLRDMRRRLGITQEDIAYGICSVPRYARIEAGHDRPTVQEFSGLMERLQERNASYDDFYFDTTADQHSLLLSLRNESLLDHWEKVGDIVSVYETQNLTPSKEKMQLISFFELIHNYYTNDEFYGFALCRSAFSILRYTQPSFHLEKCRIDFTPTFTEFMLLNAIACGMFETNQEALYTRAKSLIGELICFLSLHGAYPQSKDALICLLINLSLSESAHDDLNESRRHLDMIPACFACSGGLYLYCKALRCEYYYYRKCGYRDKCDETLSMIRFFLKKLPSSPSLSTFMKNSPKIMVF